MAVGRKTDKKVGAKHSRYFEQLRQSIHGELERTLSLVQHPSERGRVVEALAGSLLRRLLPNRYSLGTGFVVNSAGLVSNQADVVIHDRTQNVPFVVSEPLCLFPIESVYAVVEVKTTLRPSDIPKICASCARLRKMVEGKTQKEYLVHMPGPIDDKPENINKIVDKWEIRSLKLAPRFFVIAYQEKRFGSPKALIQRLKKHGRGAHIHGILIVKDDWIITQTAHAKFEDSFAAAGNGFYEFSQLMEDCMGGYPMGRANLRKYFN